MVKSLHGSRSGEMFVTPLELVLDYPLDHLVFHWFVFLALDLLLLSDLDVSRFGLPTRNWPIQPRDGCVARRVGLAPRAATGVAELPLT